MWGRKLGWGWGRGWGWGVGSHHAAHAAFAMPGRRMHQAVEERNALYSLGEWHVVLIQRSTAFRCVPRSNVAGIAPGDAGTSRRSKSSSARQVLHMSTSKRILWFGGPVLDDSIISAEMVESYGLPQHRTPNQRKRLLALMCGTWRTEELLFLRDVPASPRAISATLPMGTRRNVFDRCVRRGRARLGIPRLLHSTPTR